MNKPDSRHPFLTLKTKAFVDNLAKESAPPIYTLSPQEARNVLLKAQSQFQSKPQAEIQDDVFEVGPGGHVEVRFVRPLEKKADRPVIFYIHGGGWILGDKRTHDRLIRELALGTEATVVFPDYSPAPEKRFPTQLEELYAVLLELVRKAEEYEIDPNRVALVGDSVGGNMATALCLMLKQRESEHAKNRVHVPKIVTQFLFYPVTDASLDTESYEAFSEGPWLTQTGMKWFWNAYAPREKDRHSVLASPLRASNEELSDLPPVFIITAENDVLRDEGEAYARRLVEAGVPTTAVRYLGTIHDFVMLDALAETTPAQNAVAQCISVLRDAFQKQGR